MSADLTRNQALVMKTLSGAEAPLSAYTILDRLRGDGLRAPLQVYRALEKLTELGLVHRLESLNAFVACAHPNCHEQELIAFAICEDCGKVEEFSDDVVKDRLDGWTRSHGFRPAKTTIEIRGNCGGCAGKA
ncbi:ferric uptake regulator family protein [Nitratireductor aquibiodomus RA22]|uniref:Fur family transcriptional regulator, zinc uptake regulator n=2 Tax=Nitratireductor aquibiodomus TaxID=204799 RepID=A0A1H4LEQ3_9HYPH|nr:Fur family transcriptional regulator [Nitratireductor aquibiodomus]EIM75481.1 ferric uptake regulator family protein [Nitratireductor aquibiodomus RA22]SEB69144.1 Fur family transcriptional regulator, zinc uptake regulator [Nitratireductor aquibiodomus]